MQEKLTHKSLFTSIMTNPNSIEDPDICTTFAHGTKRVILRAYVFAYHKDFALFHVRFRETQKW